MSATVTLETVELDWMGEFETVLLFPGREFRRSIHVLLWPKESWFNAQYLKLFRDHDREDVEVVVHCARNFLPIASLIGHRIVMQKTRQMASSVFNPKSRLSTYGFDVLLQERVWKIDRWAIGSARSGDQFRMLPKKEEIAELVEAFRRKPLVIEQAALDWYRAKRALIPDRATSIELKCRWSGPLMARLENCGDSSLLGIDKQYQHKLIQEHGCEQFFLTVQLLAGLLSQWSFLGLHGAASVFSLLTPVNLLLAVETMNLSEEMLVFRSEINRQTYGVPTLGKLGLKRDFATDLANDASLFADTFGAAFKNRHAARWPAVEILKMAR